MELKIGNSCGSCQHSNRPKTPREHAAHYEVAKTERWCFKHNCHITRETTCEDHEGLTRAAKTAFTRIRTYNERLLAVKEMVILVGDKKVITADKIFYVKNNWLFYAYGNDLSKINASNDYYHYTLKTKEASTMRYLKTIKETLDYE